MVPELRTNTALHSPVNPERLDTLHSDSNMGRCPNFSQAITNKGEREDARCIILPRLGFRLVACPRCLLVLGRAQGAIQLSLLRFTWSVGEAIAGCVRFCKLFC